MGEVKDFNLRKAFRDKSSRSREASTLKDQYKNPWQTLGSRMVYKNPWLSIREDRVIRPDGSEGIYGVVDTRIATGVVALSPDQDIFLVGQYRYPTKMYSWEIIEGGTDDGEDPLSAAKRELEEEAGLVADTWSQLGGEIHLSNCITSERCYIYLAEGLRNVKACPEGTEVLTIKKLPFADALAMVDSGEIVDAVSIMGILRAQRLLGL